MTIPQNDHAQKSALPVNGQPLTDTHLLFAREASGKLLRGEPIAPRILTEQYFGPYLELMHRWHTSCLKISASAENESQVREAMEAYWIAVQVNPRYPAQVKAVDAVNIADMQADVSAARADAILAEYLKRRQPRQSLTDN
jgi:hypothetical protein